MMSLEYPRPGLHGENEKASKRGKETVMPMAELTENWRQLARGLSKDPEKLIALAHELQDARQREQPPPYRRSRTNVVMQDGSAASEGG